MADNAIEKAKKSLTQQNFSTDILENVQELKMKICELEDIANTFELGKNNKNPTDSHENDNFDNISEHKKRVNKDILESTDLAMFDMKTDKKPTEHKLLKCRVCEMEFERFCDLEWHLKAKHKECTQFECDQCQKTFVTEWRLRKHTKIHSNKITKQCHYFMNNVRCPFDDLGCKFLHVISYNSGLKKVDDSKSKEFNTMEDSAENDIDVNNTEMTNSIDTSENGRENTFFTSTPKSKKQSCEDCLDEWECINCLVINTLKKHGDRKKMFDPGH